MVHYRCSSYFISTAWGCPRTYSSFVSPVQDSPKASGEICLEGRSLGRWADLRPMSSESWKGWTLSLRVEKWPKSHSRAKTKGQNSILQVNMYYSHCQASLQPISSQSPEFGVMLFFIVVGNRQQVTPSCCGKEDWSSGCWEVPRDFVGLLGSHHLHLSLRGLWPPGKPSAWGGS